jgi:hypothetical protein
MVSCLGTDAIGEDHDALANEFAKARVRSLTAIHRQTSHYCSSALSAYRACLVPSGSTTMEGHALQTTRQLFERVVSLSTRRR